MEEATPRVNFETMQRYQNQRVMLCCQVLSVGNGQVKVQTSDKGEITVNGVNRPYESKFVEVTGRVTSPNTIDEESHLDLSENFNLDLYNELVKLTHKPEYSGQFHT